MNLIELKEHEGQEVLVSSYADWDKLPVTGWRHTPGGIWTLVKAEAGKSTVKRPVSEAELAKAEDGWSDTKRWAERVRAQGGYDVKAVRNAEIRCDGKRGRAVIEEFAAKRRAYEGAVAANKDTAERLARLGYASAHADRDRGVWLDAADAARLVEALEGPEA